MKSLPRVETIQSYEKWNADDSWCNMEEIWKHSKQNNPNIKGHKLYGSIYEKWTGKSMEIDSR
jgi:hypothetical protein